MLARKFRTTMTRSVAVALLTTVIGSAAAVGADRKVAGPRSDNTAITPLGVAVTPAGSQSRLGTLPLAAELFPDGHRLLVANGGGPRHMLQVVDSRNGRVIQTLKYRPKNGVYAGIAFSNDGTKAYVSGGGNGRVHEYDVAGKGLVEQPFRIIPPAGPNATFTGGLSLTPDGNRLLVTDVLNDALTIVDLQTQAVTSIPVGHAPRDVVVTEDGTTAYVSNQGATTVTAVTISGPEPVIRTTIAVGTHPNVLLLDSRKRLFVANGDSDDVSIINTTTNRVVGRIDLAPYRGARVGTAPAALTMSPDESTLFVANAGNNALAVVNPDRRKVLGLIPTGWYPTAVVANDTKVFVTNGKGLGAGPNAVPEVPVAEPVTPETETDIVGKMMFGTLTRISWPMSTKMLAEETRQVIANNGFAKQSPRGKFPPAIKHVIYVVKENRTYDQVLGSLGKGNGDPRLNLFGEESAPNARALARRFVTLDNFYSNADVSAQGWNWSTSANSNPYTEWMRPSAYASRWDAYPSESGDPAIAGAKNPAKAYIWNRLADKNVSFRNYGFFVDKVSGEWHAADPQLNARTNHAYTGFDLGCPANPDTFRALHSRCGITRIEEWLREFNAYVQTSSLPTVQFVRMPNDHTAGTKVGLPTPRAYVADDDLALGRLVEAVSHSKYWASTAILVTEDDAQNGPDHVDAHRTISQVISPYSQHGTVDSTFYSTASMLRTIADIVGVDPLTQFDTYATPMTRSFKSTPNLTPYDAVIPEVATDERNGQYAPMAATSKAQSLRIEEQVDEQQFNAAIWKSVKGADSPMPQPRFNVIGPTADDD